MTMISPMTRHGKWLQGVNLRRGFTLFEVMIALGVFAVAVTGIVVALDTALRTALEVRHRSFCREALESRLDYCLVNPPGEGNRRVLRPEQNQGIRVEESLIPYSMKNVRGQVVAGMKKLTITASSGDQSDSAEVLIYQP